MLREITSKHHQHQPLNPYMIVVTLHPSEFSLLNIDSLAHIRTITIRKHHDVFQPRECLLLWSLSSTNCECGFNHPFRLPSGGCMCCLGLLHSSLTSTLALTLSFVFSEMFRIVLKRDSATFFSVCITSMLWGSANPW